MYQSRSIWKLTVIAVSLSVLLHLLFIVYSYNKKIEWTGNYESVTMAPKIIDVEFIDEEQMKVMQEESEVPQKNEKITNIDFNSEDARENSDKRYDSKTEQQIQEQVEKELREFEAEEFAKLKKEKVKDIIVDKTKTTEDGFNTEDAKTENTATSHSFAGSVTAEWYLTQRGKEKLLKPSYVCKGGGKVKVNIIVDREGLVIEASINKKESFYKESCIGENALAYAKKCRFSVSTVAPVQQEGWILYTFIAQ